MRGSRLLTLAGPPGIGKSDSTVEAARREVGRFPDGVFYVDCSTVTDERYFGNKVGSVLGVPETPVVAPGFAASEFLKSKRALVVLDNCDAVSNLCSQYVRALLAQTTETRILVTSREPTAHGGRSRIHAVPPLSDADAIALFLERASAASLCDPAPARSGGRGAHVRAPGRAAARPAACGGAVAHDGLQQLETRLAAYDAENRDEFTQWSYEVLTPVEQRLLRGLSVFSGGAEEDAIAAVCGNADGLLALADKGLVNIEAGPGEALHRSGIDSHRGVGTGERVWRAADAGAAHARYYAKRARELDERHPTKQWKAALAAMAPELDNLRAALLFTVTQGYDLAVGRRSFVPPNSLLAAIGPRIGRTRLDRAVACAQRHGVRRGRARKIAVRIGASRQRTFALRAGKRTARRRRYRKLGDETGLPQRCSKGCGAFGVGTSMRPTHIYAERWRSAAHRQ